MSHIINSVLKIIDPKEISKIQTTQMSGHKMIVDTLHEGPSNGVLWQIIHDGKIFIFSTILKNRYSWKYISWLEHLDNINESLSSIPGTASKE